MEGFLERFFLFGLVLVFTPFCFSQALPAASWTGQAQCQLTVQTPNYVYQEIQTWMLTGDPPTAQGAMQVYPATWSVTGQGSRQDTQGPQITAMQWNTNVAPISAPMVMFTRASDNRMLIGAWHSQLRANNAINGLRRVTVSGIAQNPSAVSYTEFEWKFPSIQDDPNSTSVSGKSSQSTSNAIGLLQPAGSTGNEVCQWQFTKGAVSSRNRVAPGAERIIPPSGGAAGGAGAAANAGAGGSSGGAAGGAANTGVGASSGGAAAGAAGAAASGAAGGAANAGAAGTSSGAGASGAASGAAKAGAGASASAAAAGGGAAGGAGAGAANTSSAATTATVQMPVSTLGSVQPISGSSPIATASPTAVVPTAGTSSIKPTPIVKQVAPVSGKPPLTGWVDLHTHPMSNLAFGGKLFHGAPDSGPTSLMPGIEVPRNTGCVFDVPAADISQALSQDGPTSGDPFQSKCGDFIRNTFAKVMELATDDAQQQPGNANGYPDFTNWPRWNDIRHQKMWWEWIQRAQNGGLRVMVALAHNSRLLAEVVLDGHAAGPISGYTDDANSADLQIREIVSFVNHHSDVMELAKTSSDLYNIVQRGHIAVVLGIEVDNLGDFNDKQPVSTKMVDDEINRLYNNGVRYIFPIHLTDNVFGDTALYDGLFNLANFRETGRFWTVGCSHPGDQVSAHMLGLPPNFPIPPGVPAPPQSPPCPGAGTAIPTATGNVNVRTPGGLTSLGQYAVKAMMKRGMIVDIDHMSNAAVETALQMAEKVPNGGFPLMSGHSGVRNVANFNKENSRTPDQLKRIACLGGMFGLGTDGAKATDWAREYAGAFNIMNGAFASPGTCANPSLGAGMVAFGTDMNSLVKSPRPTMTEFAPGDVPRFADIYNANNPNNTDNPFLPVLPRSQSGARTWDYNTDGVAHYGMLADFVRDVRTAPASQPMNGKDLVDNHLLRSADYFYRMWQKVETQKNNVQ